MQHAGYGYKLFRAASLRLNHPPDQITLSLGQLPGQFPCGPVAPYGLEMAHLPTQLPRPPGQLQGQLPGAGAPVMTGLMLTFTLSVMSPVLTLGSVGSPRAPRGSPGCGRPAPPPGPPPDPVPPEDVAADADAGADANAELEAPAEPAAAEEGGPAERRVVEEGPGAAELLGPSTKGGVPAVPILWGLGG